jgi:hypothetical protein
MEEAPRELERIETKGCRAEDLQRKRAKGLVDDGWSKRRSRLSEETGEWGEKDGGKTRERRPARRVQVPALEVVLSE